jgi:hypothetical protein
MFWIDKLEAKTSAVDDLYLKMANLFPEFQVKQEKQ